MSRIERVLWVRCHGCSSMYLTSGEEFWRAGTTQLCERCRVKPGMFESAADAIGAGLKYLAAGLGTALVIVQVWKVVAR